MGANELSTHPLAKSTLQPSSPPLLQLKEEKEGKRMTLKLRKVGLPKLVLRNEGDERRKMMKLAWLGMIT